jgi:hypothetical protein
MLYTWSNYVNFSHTSLHTARPDLIRVRLCSFQTLTISLTFFEPAHLYSFDRPPSQSCVLIIPPPPLLIMIHDYLHSTHVYLYRCTASGYMQVTYHTHLAYTNLSVYTDQHNTYVISIYSLSVCVCLSSIAPIYALYLFLYMSGLFHSKNYSLLCLI